MIFILTVCANESIQGFALYTATLLFLSAGPLQMVSEHCVAYRFEALSLDRNRITKNKSTRQVDTRKTKKKDQNVDENRFFVSMARLNLFQT